ncbi:thioredoxin family protein [Methylophilus sp. Leaf414]|uniref:thioredoxin family protein n=1 Tax=Methylophilus sp. Leaf414 TaxID=1736371 RepID=UPI0006F7784B|nr:thioredoxin family protein [Methylophilus sp. Leaf414]KQT36543.1 thioredoxin [Methylophilus sp. Leaf414]
MFETQPLPEPSREQVDALIGAVVLEFGTGWCGHCQAAQTAITSGLSQFPQVQHIKIEDGKGRRLGRSFKVKLWPTLIFLKDGIEQERLVRQINAGELNAALLLISTP